MKCFCPGCGEEAITDRVALGADAYNLLCVQCGLQSVVFLGDQLVSQFSAPWKTQADGFGASL